MTKLLPIILIVGIVVLFQTSSAKEMVGWVEKARLYPGAILIKAKIDSGAKTSSINCNCVTPIEKNGEKWVRFSVTGESGKVKWYERKITRTVKIKRHFGESQRRFVVTMGICLGDVYKDTEVNLVDRSGLNYPLLIGRRFLQGSHTIDPGETFISKPRCKRATINE